MPKEHSPILQLFLAPLLDIGLILCLLGKELSLQE